MDACSCGKSLHKCKYLNIIIYIIPHFGNKGTTYDLCIDIGVAWQCMVGVLKQNNTSSQREEVLQNEELVAATAATTAAAVAVAVFV
jgi:hypothetical protein